MKYYFKEIDSETCYGLKMHMQEAKEDDLDEIELYEALPEPSGDYFYCRAHETCGEKADGECGRHCFSYSPCNGKSGRCRYMGKTYIHGELKKFKV